MKRKAFLRRLLAVPLAVASLFSLVPRARGKLFAVRFGTTPGLAAGTSPTMLFKRETTFGTEPDERKWLKLKATATMGGP